MARSDGRNPATPIPARLHVLLARDDATALVIRRGPSKHTAVIGWDRRTDRFTMGQWLYGRLYERRCDLSPDGEHFLYFAMNGRWDGPAKGAWSAISRAPYLRALTLLPKGDCWHGGGLFLDARRCWINDGTGHQVARSDAPIARSTESPFADHYGGECPGVYYHRLQRDGWRFVEHRDVDDRGAVAVFDKPLRHRWRLRKVAHESLDHPAGRGCYFDEHELHDERTGEIVRHPDWEWADDDGRRLMWAEAGRLHAARIGRDGLFDEKMLHDFNAMRFERLQAPYG